MWGWVRYAKVRYALIAVVVGGRNDKIEDEVEVVDGCCLPTNEPKMTLYGRGFNRL